MRLGATKRRKLVRENAADRCEGEGEREGKKVALLDQKKIGGLER